MTCERFVYSCDGGAENKEYIVKKYNKINNAMKKTLHLLLLALLLPIGAGAQEELTVYDGTSSSYYVPAYVYYWDDFTRSQFVIPAEDLSEMNGGTITALTFYTTDENIPYTSVSTADVYLMEVDYTSISAYEPKQNVVYSGLFTFEQTADGGQVTIEFATPYEYQGGNLLIGIDNTTDMGYTIINFYGQSASGASVAGSDGSSVDDVPAYQQGFIPKTTFTYEMAGVDICRKPSGLTVDALTATEATVSWTPRNEESQWVVYLNGVFVGGTTVNSYTFSGLDPQTTYSWSVCAVCPNGDSSSLATASFTTPCGSIMTFPYTNNFQTTESYVLPDCWSNMTSDAAVVYNSDGANMALLVRGGGTVVSQPFAISSNNMYITLRCKSYGTKVYVAPVGATASDLTDDRLVLTTEYNYDWASYSITTEGIDFEGDAVLVFVSTSTYQYSYSYIDDITVRPIPTCWEPSGLRVAAGGPDQVTLAWSADAAQCRLEWYDEAGSQLGSVVTVDSNYTISGLTPQTSYLAVLRALCSDDDSSDLTFLNFYTTCEALTSLPQTFAFGDETVGETPDCWLQLAGSVTVEQDYDDETWRYLDFNASGMVATPPVAWPSDSLYVSLRMVNSGYLRYGVVAAGGGLSDVQWISTTYASAGATFTFTTEGFSVGSQVSIVFSDYYGYGIAIDSVFVAPYTGCQAPYAYNNWDRITDQGTTIEWDGSGAVAYEVMVSSSESWQYDTTLIVDTVETTSYTVEGLQQNKYYYYWVRAICEDYVTPWGSYNSFQTKYSYDTMQSAYVQVVDYASARLNIYPFGRNCYYATTGYLLKVRPADGGEWTEYNLNADAQVFVIPNLSEGTAYEFALSMMSGDAVADVKTGSFTTKGCNVFGTESLGWTGNYPVNHGYQYSYMQTIIHAGELENRGNEVSGITFYRNLDEDTHTYLPHYVDIYMGHTDTAQYEYNTSNGINIDNVVPVVNLTLVAHEAELICNGAESHIAFDQPFVRDVNRNLVIAIYDSLAPIGEDGGLYWRTGKVSDSADNRTAFFYSYTNLFTPGGYRLAVDRGIDDAMLLLKLDFNSCNQPDLCEQPTVNASSQADGIMFSISPARSDYHYSISYRKTYDRYQGEIDDAEWQPLADDVTTGSYLLQGQYPSFNSYEVRVTRTCADGTELEQIGYFSGNCIAPNIYYRRAADGVHRELYFLSGSYEPTATYTVSYRRNDEGDDEFRTLGTMEGDTYVVNLDLPSNHYYIFRVSRPCGDEVLIGETGFYGTVNIPYVWTSNDPATSHITLNWENDGKTYSIDYRNTYEDEEYTPLGTVSDTNSYVLDFDLSSNDYYEFRLGYMCSDGMAYSTASTYGNCGAPSYVYNNGVTDTGCVVYTYTTRGARYLVGVRSVNGSLPYEVIDSVAGNGNTVYYTVDGLPSDRRWQIGFGRVCGGDTSWSYASTYGSCGAADIYESERTADGVTVAWTAEEGMTFEVAYYDDNTGEYVVVDPANAVGSYTFVGFNADRSYQVRIGKQCTYGMSYSSMWINGTCQAPDFTVNEVTSNSISISWTGDGVSLYKLYVYDINQRIVAAYLPSDVAENSYTFTGLNAATDYYVHIARTCISGDVVNAQHVVTLCDPTPVPYNIDFRNSSISNCWATGTIGNIDDWSYTYSGTNYMNDGNRVYMLNYGGSVVLPEFDRPLNELQLHFVFYASNPNTDLHLGVCDDQNDMTNLVELATLRHGDYGSEEEVSVTYRFADLTTDESYKYIVLYAPIDSANYEYRMVRSLDVDVIPACLEVSGLAVTGVGDSTASLSWTAAEGSFVEYIVEYGPKGFTLGDGQTGYANTNSITLTNLEPGTTYQAYVRVNCGRKGESYSSSPVSFTTGCVPVSGFYTDFRGVVAMGQMYSDQLPNCWTYDHAIDADTNGLTAPRTTSGNNNYYGNALEMVSLACVAMPELSRPVGETMIEMEVAYLGSGSMLVLGTVSSNATGFADNFEPIDTIRTTGRYTRYLDSYTGSNRFLALRNVNATGSESALAMVSSVRVYDLPSCFTPENVTVSNITENSAVIDWTDHVPTTSWRVTYYDDYSYNYRDTIVSSHPVSLEGLRSAAYHYVNVYTRCSNYDESGNGSVNFRTNGSCLAPVESYVADHTATSVTLDWSDQGDPAEWQVRVTWMQNGYQQYDYYNYTAHPAVIAGLWQGRDYTFYISARCASDNSWTGESMVQYTTTCDTQVVSLDAPLAENFNSVSYELPACWQVETIGEGHYEVTYGYYWYGRRYPVVMGSDYDNHGEYKLYSRPFRLEDTSMLALYTSDEYGNAMFSVDYVTEDAGEYTYVAGDTLYAQNGVYTDTLEPNVVQVVVHYMDTNSMADYRSLYVYGLNINIIPREDCETPYEAEVSSVTTSSATVTVRDAAGQPVAAQVRLTEQISGSTTLVTTDATGMALFEGLNHSTTYTVEARAICGEAYSHWVTLSQLTTECAAISTLPHNFTFGNDYFSTPDCWAYDPMQMSDPTAAPQTGSYYGYYVATDTTIMAMPEYAGELADVSLSFYASEYSYAGVASWMVVGVVDSVTPGFAASFTPVDTIYYADGVNYTVYFNNYVGNGRHIAIKNVSGMLQMRNVYLDAVPECTAPYRLMATEVTASTITVDWEDVRPAERWIVRCSGYNMETRVDTVSEHPYTIDGLTPGTSYSITVTALCADGTQMGNYISVTTPCGAITTLPYRGNFNVYGQIPGCWAVDAVSESGNAYSRYGSLYMYGNVVVAAPMLGVDLDSVMLTITPGLYNDDSQDNTFEVGVVDSNYGDFAESFVPVYSTAAEDMNSVDRNIFFDSYSGQGKYIAMRLVVADTTNTETYMRLGSFKIDTILACTPVANLTVTNVTDTSVTIDWSDRNEGPWYVTYYEDNNYNYEYINPETHPVTITGLKQNRRYVINVFPSCDASGATVYVTTNCGVNTTLPLSYYFNEGYYYFDSWYSDRLPNCWDYDAGVVAEGHRVPQVAQYYWDDTRLLMGYSDLVTLPVLQTDVQHFNVSMQLYPTHTPASGETQRLVLGTTTADGGYSNGFVALDTIDYDGVTYGKVVNVTVQADFSTARRFALKAVADSTFLIDNINIERAPSCEKPTELVVTEVGTTSVTLDWTNVDATEWEVRYELPDGGYRTMVAESHPYEVSGLRPGTDYRFWVRGICGTDDYTDYANAVDVTTDCDVVTTLPVTYDFDDDFAGHMPSCWAYDPEATLIDSTNSMAGAPVLYWYSSGNGNVFNLDYSTALALPEMTVPVNTTTVEFDIVEAGGTSSDATIEIGVVSDNAPGFAQTMTTVATLHYTDAGLVGHHTVDFGSYAGNGNRVAIRTVTPIDEWHYIVLDNVTFTTTMAPCEPPVDFSVDSVGINEATFSWTADAGAGSYELLLENSTSYNVYTVSGTSYTATDLERGVSYMAAVRSICGNSGVRSEWSDTVSFTTIYCDPYVPTNVTVSEITPDSAVVSWTAAPGDDTWVVRAILTGVNDPSLYNAYGIDSSLVSLGYYSIGQIAYTNPFTMMLVPGCTFALSVATVCDESGYGRMSEPVIFSTPMPDCPTFNNFVAENVTESSATISWTDGFESSREVYVVPAGMDLTYARNNGLVVYRNYSVDTTVVTVSGLLSSTSYDLYVIAWCGSSMPVVSDAFTFTTSGVCHVPTRLTATAVTATTISVSWSTQADNTLVAIGTGELATDADAVTVDSTSYTFSDLQPGTAYTIGVRSQCETVWHTISVTTDTVASDDTTAVPCNVPSSLVVTGATATTLSVSWTTEAGTTQVGIAATADWPAGATLNMTGAKTYTFTGLEPETEYTVGVRSLCDSTWVTVSGTTAACLVVTGVTVSGITETSAVIDWEDSAAAWRIEYGPTGFAQGQGTVVNATAKPYTLTGLTENTGYDVYVHRQCASQIWTVSDVVSFTTEAHCYGPENIVVDSVSTTTVTVHWSTQAAATLVAITSGTVSDNLSNYTIVSATSHTFTGLVPGTQYTVALRSECETMWHTVVATTDTLPSDDTTYVCPSPTDLAATATHNSITATWSTEAPVTLVAIAQGTTLPATAAGTPVNTTSYTFDNLAASTLYTVGVRSQCDDEWLTTTLSTAAAPDTTEPGPQPVCEVPQNVTVSGISASGATVAWDAVEGAEAYEIQLTNETQRTVTSVTTSYTFDDLSDSTAYSVRVRTVCSANEQRYSDWSSAASFTTLGDHTGIAEVAEAAVIELYPNPASDKVNITVAGVEGSVRVAIVDINGKVARTFDTMGGQTVAVDIEGLSQGVYFVRLQSNGVSVVRKLIVR